MWRTGSHEQFTSNSCFKTQHILSFGPPQNGVSLYSLFVWHHPVETPASLVAFLTSALQHWRLPVYLFTFLQFYSPETSSSPRRKWVFAPLLEDLKHEEDGSVIWRLLQIISAHGELHPQQYCWQPLTWCRFDPTTVDDLLHLPPPTPHPSFSSTASHDHTFFHVTPLLGKIQLEMCRSCLREACVRVKFWGSKCSSVVLVPPPHTSTDYNLKKERASGEERERERESCMKQSNLQTVTFSRQACVFFVID